MKDCNQLFSELLDRTASAGFIVVVLMLILIIIINIIERANAKFKQRIYEEFKKKQEKDSKKSLFRGKIRSSLS